MADYTLTNHMTGESHELDYENVVDMKAALDSIKAFNSKVYPFETAKKRELIYTWECFDETFEKMSKVTTPDTDY